MEFSTDIARDERQYLEMEFLASEPYTSFVFSSIDQALRVRDYLFERNLCEFSQPYGRVLRDGDRAIGMLALLNGAELERCRLRAAIALVKSNLVRDDADTVRRLKSAGQTLMKARPDDFYLSRLAAAETARGRGVGTQLLNEVEREARSQKSPRIVLEVCSSSVAALQLYQRAGFQELDRRFATDQVTDRSLEYIHLAKPLL